MKKMSCLIMLLCIVVTLNAQDRPQREGRERGERIEKRRDHIKNMSPEQIATLRTKKMAIDLDLNERQKNDLLKLNIELANERKEKAESMKARKEKGETLTDEERFNLANERLDKQYEVQQKMKNILNEEQYALWKKQHHRKKRGALKKRAQYQKKRRQN